MMEHRALMRSDMLNSVKQIFKLHRANRTTLAPEGVGLKMLQKFLNVLEIPIRTITTWVSGWKMLWQRSLYNFPANVAYRGRGLFVEISLFPAKSFECGSVHIIRGKNTNYCVHVNVQVTLYGSNHDKKQIIFKLQFHVEIEIFEWWMLEIISLCRLAQSGLFQPWNQEK